MRQLQTEAIILKRLNFGEADRILTVITPEYGKISLLAKGVRRAKSKLAGGLELFSISDITYIDGRSDLKTVVSTRLKTHFRHIVEDVDKTMIAYEFLKITDLYAEHVVENLYYAHLVKGLEGLENKTENANTVQVWFYTIILQTHGSSVNTEKPIQATDFQDDSRYDFSYDDMSFYPHQSGEFHSRHIKFLRLVKRAENPSQLNIVKDNDTLSADLVNLLKQSTTMHKA